MIPFGGFNLNIVTSRPTANTVSSGSVTNAANAYDADPATFANWSGNASWTVQAWGAATKSGVVVTVTYAYDASAVGAPGSSATIVISGSTDSGTSYTYTFLSATYDSGQSTDGTVSGTASITIPSSLIMANLKVKFESSVAGSGAVNAKIYDVTAQYY